MCDIEHSARCALHINGAAPPRLSLLIFLLLPGSPARASVLYFNSHTRPNLLETLDDTRLRACTVLWTRAGNESHAGQVFTCIGALSLAGRLDLVDRDLFCWWWVVHMCTMPASHPGHGCNTAVLRVRLGTQTVHIHA